MIDKLLYYPQFCMSAIVSTAVLLLLFFAKRNFPSRKNRIFLLMLIDSLLSSGVDILTFLVISFPEKYPLWFCYAVNIGYLFLFNMMSVLFMLYVDSLTKIGRIMVPVKIFAGLTAAAVAVLLLISPFTRLTIYFDDALVYKRGPLMPVIYLLSFLPMLFGAVLFFQSGKKFTVNQRFAISAFIFGNIISIVTQTLNPKYVITNFMCSMMLFFVYISFENQAYFLHGETPCFNRRAFIRTVHKLKKQRRPYTVIAIKLEEYENIAHSIGRSETDKLSQRVAERLSRVFRRLAFIIDGNCYAIIKEGEADVDAMVASIRGCFDSPFVAEIDGEIKRMTINPEITVLSITDQVIGGHEMSELVMKLDDHVSSETVFVEDVMERIAPIRREREVLRIIDNAILNKSFEVYYQPILDVRTRRFVCCEALVRMRDENGVFVSPDEFIPIAERSGRINEIGIFVFKEVCRFIRDEHLKELGVDYIEINLSPEQCKNLDLARRLIEIMNEYGVSPTQLNLEITETARIEKQSLSMLSATISSLHNEGISFSLDDFGSGFSALNYLITLPVDIVKIDKSILWKAMDDKYSMRILRDTMRMIRDIGKQIVVEGIETEEMATTLIDNGCDFLQGYLFSKPLPQDRFLEFIRA